MNVVSRIAKKFFPRPILNGTDTQPIEEDESGDDAIMPDQEDLDELRQGQLDYISWLDSSYAHEMKRRKAYYEMNQMQSDAGALAELEATYIDPASWNYAHSGPGWEDIRAMLPDATEETCVKPVPTNYTEVIINNRQVVYDTPAEAREIIGPDGKVMEEPTKWLELIYESCKHDLVSRYLCRWTGLYSTAFQVISYDKEEGRLIKTNVEPYRVRVIGPTGVNNLQHPDVVVSIAQDTDTLGDIGGDEIKAVWQVWWRDMWWYETIEGSPCTDIDCTEPGWHQNPFKDKNGRPVKPILVVHDNPTVTKIHEPGSDILIQQNQNIDRMFTGNGHTMEFQTFAVPVITGADLEEVEAQPYSAGAPQVYRSDLTKFQFAHPAAPIGEAVGASTRITRTFARLHQIDPELVDPETKVQSGVSRAQARTALTERRNQEFPKWESYERESYWISAIVWNTFNPDVLLPLCDRYVRPGKEAIRILIRFGEVDLAIDALSEGAANKMDFDLNLITQAEIIAARRKIPLERATALHAKIKEQNEKDKPKTESPFDQKTPRIGQSGNRPIVDERDKSKVGGNTTSATGNKAIEAK